MARSHTNRSPHRNAKVKANDPEPSIHDLLGDPVLQILMARDGVARDELLDIVDAARTRLGLDDARAHAAFEATLFAECRA
jgi:hypothetical protein